MKIHLVKESVTDGTGLIVGKREKELAEKLEGLYYKALKGDVVIEEIKEG